MPADITAGKLAPGARLPNELELAEQYGVVRLTVRRAMELLVSEGRIVVLRGRGTYVRQDEPGMDDSQDV